MVELVSFVIPVADYHLHLVDRAAASVEKQTVPSLFHIVLDADNRGAGYCRNQGLAKVLTPFVSFLDSDDTIEPDYVEKMLAYYQQGHYVYCDDTVHSTPDSDVYLTPASWHCVTALTPTAAAKYVDGFDETLPALEDKDFYLKLQAHGFCGVRCPYPLVHYTGDGLRSNLFKANPNHATIRSVINERWIERAYQMCCGKDIPVTAPDESAKQEGDVLAQVIENTGTGRRGRVTGRWYNRPKAHQGYQQWVAPEDVATMPKDFKLVASVIDPKKLTPNVDEIQAMFRSAVNG